jgi:hypothetical protein
MTRAALVCLAGAMLMIAAACGGPYRYLTWRTQPPAPALVGKVTIAVVDHRVAGRGGDDPTEVGSERGALLVKSTLRMSTPTEVAEAIHDLLGQAALTAGIGVAAPDSAGGTAKIAVEIQSLWCEGVMAAYTRAQLGANLTVLAPDGSVRLAGVPLQVEGGGGSCSGAFERLMANAYASAVAVMSEPQVRGALTGSAGPPPAR